ncbi:hypothetical protein HDU96_001022 [Phlyctochytrium bullatum]|nr:hypothetical protein HDU96_001022 [Phlyctochytrium bullatum]
MDPIAVDTVPATAGVPSSHPVASANQAQAPLHHGQVDRFHDSNLVPWPNIFNALFPMHGHLTEKEVTNFNDEIFRFLLVNLGDGEMARCQVPFQGVFAWQVLVYAVPMDLVHSAAAKLKEAVENLRRVPLLSKLPMLVGPCAGAQTRVPVVHKRRDVEPQAAAAGSNISRPAMVLRVSERTMLWMDLVRMAFPLCEPTVAMMDWIKTFCAHRNMPLKRDANAVTIPRKHWVEFLQMFIAAFWVAGRWMRVPLQGAGVLGCPGGTERRQHGGTTPSGACEDVSDYGDTEGEREEELSDGPDVEIKETTVRKSKEKGKGSDPSGSTVNIQPMPPANVQAGPKPKAQEETGKRERSGKSRGNPASKRRKVVWNLNEVRAMRAAEEGQMVRTNQPPTYYINHNGIRLVRFW